MSKLESEFTLPRVKLSQTDTTVIDLNTTLKKNHKNPHEMIETARSAFNEDCTKSLKFRKQQLKLLLKMYTENEDAMYAALAKDLNKSKQESSIFEIEFIKNDLINVINKFERWAKPENRYKSAMNALNDLKLYKDPYGVVLIFGAWNYPLQSTLLPIAGAIAAGNCIIIKPSILASETANFIATTIPKYLNNDCYHVHLGDELETNLLLEERFDYIFFTGRPDDAKIIHQAAAEYLTPTTLVLGGKNPVYLDDTADIEMATKRILWGKCMNAGQTCIGPEYLLCSREVQEQFLRYVPKLIEEWYGIDPKHSPDFCRMITDSHFNRVIKLMKDKKIAFGGFSDPLTRYIHPTILIDVSPNDPIMHEEIFGPVLPIINVNSAQEAITFINAREKPLSMYIFSKNKKLVESMLRKTSCGGVTVNDTLLHIAAESLPFGGVGTSGIGSYHGKATFDTFVHHKSVLKKSMNALLDKIESVRYPPYNNFKLNLMQQVMKKRYYISLRFVPYLLIFILGVVVTLIALNI